MLEWITTAISLINTILLFWLGATVLINAERRSWGVVLVSGGLLISATFFISHTAILGHGLIELGDGMDFWWLLGLCAAVALPFAWYMGMLWYAGFFDDRRSALHQRQRLWFAASILVTICMAGLLIFDNPFPSYYHVIALQLSSTLTLAGLPLLVVLYPISILLGMGLALDALLRPGSARRMMGDLARRRAQPWLVATSITLLLVGLLVAGVMVWVVFNAHQREYDNLRSSMTLLIYWCDLLIEGLITAGVILLGQAVVCYEVFTGKTLPQHRFLRHWRNVVILAVSFGTVMSACLQLRLHPIYSILLSGVMMSLLYVLFNQRSYLERERYIQQLRPFVSSQRLYDQLIAGSVPAEIDISRPFQMLCSGVLDTQLAYLIASGPLAPLVNPISYPMPSTPPPINELAAQCTSPQTMCVLIDPARYGGALWAIPLWSERGLIGVLLLGEKRAGGLYAQEEIEIARASGERLIDTQASAEMARRLMALQRERLAENQVIDRRTRRALHDEVLPRLHTAMLSLADDNSTGSAVVVLADIHKQIANLLHDMPARIVSDVVILGLIPALRKVVDDDLGSAFDDVTYHIEPDAEAETQLIPALTAEVIYYAARESIRNAARYGRGDDPARTLTLRIDVLCCETVEIRIEDNGIGLESPKPSERLPNHSGHGLALHSTMMAVVGGALTVESVPSRSTRVSLRLPPIVSAPVI